jgi:protease YdgD
MIAVPYVALQRWVRVIGFSITSRIRFSRLRVLYGLSMALLVGGAGVPVLSGPILPGLGGHDPRVRQDPAAWPWRAVARLQIPGAGRCTAFLVAPRVVLTAAHCLYVRRAGHFAPAQSVHVLTGYGAGRFARHAVATGYRLAPGYDPRHVPPDFGADVAVVTLDRAMAAPGEVLRVAQGEAPSAAMLGGYNQDRAEVIEADPACAVLGGALDAAGRPLLRHDCAATRGTSGAPLLVRTQGGWRVAGLQVAAANGRASGIAVPAATLREVLAAPPLE